VSKIIGIVGSRRRDTRQDFEAVEAAFRKAYEPGDRIVSGGCHRGGDRFAEIIALQLAKPGHWTLGELFHLSAYRRHWFIKESGAPIILHLPNWDEDGRAAAFVRNGLIARDADVLIACVAADRKGGTEDTIRKFLDKPASKAADDKERNLLLC
jgi:hypothetical protein